MMSNGWTVVLDVGKTLAKATLWDETGRCVASRSRPNRQPVIDGLLSLDVTGIEQWLQVTLREFAGLGPVNAIVPVAHGAGAAIIRNGQLQGAPLDYEWRGASADRELYDKQRDPFKATGSPALPAGLNLGAQLHRLESMRSSEVRSGSILPWAQFWSWRLSGVTASEISSLGCHTDLWRPLERRPSQLAERRGWAARLAPMQPAGAILGRLTPEWVENTGLSSQTEIYCGLHDSNAALVAARTHPELQGRDATVLSTGTWFVAMRTPASASIPDLPETRDCLINVDIDGAPVPSSRFMGGRELEILLGTEASRIDTALHDKTLQDRALQAIERGEMILPSLIPGVGPFPSTPSRSTGVPRDHDATAVALLYAALVADVSLDLIESRDTLLVDGRFSKAPTFVQALASLRPDTAVFVSNDDSGVAHGALSLVAHTNRQTAALQRIFPFPTDLTEYRARWREAAER